MTFLSIGLVPTHQRYSQNNTPKTNRGRRGPEYSFKKKDQLLIYKSSRCTEFSLKKLLYTINTVQKKSLSYSTSFVSKISKRGVVGWRQEEYREDCLGEGRKEDPVSCSSGGVGVVGIALSLSRARTHSHRMTQASARLDGMQVLWNTGLSPCFLIFQGLWATG